MLKKITFLFLLCSIFLCGCNEQKKFEVPKLTGRIVDTSNTLTSDQKIKIENAILNFEKNTGGQFAVCIVPEMYGESVESASMKVAESWKIGNKDKDDGIIFFLSMKEREFRIEVGYGFEGQLNDGKAGDLGRIAIPKFKDKKYDEGIISIINGSSEIISGKKTIEQIKEENKAQIPTWLWITISIGILLIIIDCCINGGNAFTLLILMSLMESSGSGGRGGFSGGGGKFGGGGFSGKF